MASALKAYRPIGKRGHRYPEWVRDLHGKSGVYVIRDLEGGATQYVGESHKGRLKKTLLRHFQRWVGRTAGPTFSRSSVEVSVKVTPSNRAVKAQDRLIFRLKPALNGTNPVATEKAAEAAAVGSIEDGL